MTRRFVTGLAGFGIALLASQAMAVDWHYVGTSQFTGGIPQHQDVDRFPVNDIIIDGAGYVYATAQNGDNDVNAGGLTIYPPNYYAPTNTPPKIDIEFSAAAGRRGAITKMVVAGDGKVYGVVNWLEPNWAYVRGCGGTQGPSNTCITSRLVRIDPTANPIVEVIKDFTPTRDTKDGAATGDGNWRNRIAGLTVGPEGFVYFIITGGDDNFFKFHFLWRYDWANDLVEESPRNGITNNSFGGYVRVNNLEYVGFDSNNNVHWFAVLGEGGSGSGGDHNWPIDAIAWDQDRRGVINGASNPGWGRKIPSHFQYDPIRKRLWAGGAGRASGANNTLIMSRWHGDPAVSGLLNVPAGFATDPSVPVRTGTGNDAGSPNAQVWHVTGNETLQTARPYLSALDVNPGTGAAWMAWGGHVGYTSTAPFGSLGVVYTMGPDDTTTSGNEGTPQAAHSDVNKRNNASHVVGIAFSGDTVYALVFDLVTAEYSVYSSVNPTPGCADPAADSDRDGDVDMVDFGTWQACYTGIPSQGQSFTIPFECSCFDVTHDSDIDQDDFNMFRKCMEGSLSPLIQPSGPGIPADPTCDN